MEEHGMEIAEFFAGKYVSASVEDLVEDFFNGIAKYMNGQSFEEAFKDNFDREAFEMRASSNILDSNYKIDLKNNIKYVYSYRLDDYVCPPDANSPNEDIKDDAPRKDEIQQYKEAKEVVSENISEQVLERLHVNLGNPEEAQAFIAQIDNYIERSEMRDKGYSPEFAEDSISKAKMIADFSGNEKWNAVMKMLA